MAVAENPHPIPDQALIQQQLDEILRSAPFRTTRQCQDLLRYVVTNSLAGFDHLLRERVIGAEVFGRKPDYDTGEDPVVRLRAAEVRKRLAQFYQAAPAEWTIHIDIPPGSYRAIFHRPSRLETTQPVASSLSTAVALADAQPAPVDSTGLKQLSEHLSEIAPIRERLYYRRPLLWLIAAVALIVAMLALLRFDRYGAEAAHRRFWAPIVNGSKPVLICMGTNAVYRLSNQFLLRYLAQNDQHSELGFDFFAELPPDSQIAAHDLEKAYNSFVALGDVAAVSDVVADLTRRGKPFTERFPPDISFAELQNTPTISVGGYNNPLTLTLTKDLRFVMVQGNRIVDRQNPARSWETASNGDSHDTDDYAVISRLVDAKTSGPVLALAGIGQYGTRAAAEFVSSPESLILLDKAAPKNWSQRNVQIVLHIHVVNFRPISKEIVATNYW